MGNGTTGKINISGAGKEVKIDQIAKAGTAEGIIAERVKGLDLSDHTINNRQLSRKKMKEFRSKIDDRTITKEEWERYNWNKRFGSRRDKGVRQFWKQEKERIINDEPLTKDWTSEQIETILNNKRAKFDGNTIQGHHTYSASKYPHLCNKGEVIYPATKNEHFNGWHGGNYKNSLPGKPIIDIDDFLILDKEIE